MKRKNDIIKSIRTAKELLEDEAQVQLTQEEDEFIKKAMNDPKLMNMFKQKYEARKAKGGSQAAQTGTNAGSEQSKTGSVEQAQSSDGKQQNIQSQSKQQGGVIGNIEKQILAMGIDLHKISSERLASIKKAVIPESVNEATQKSDLLRQVDRERKARASQATILKAGRERPSEKDGKVIQFLKKLIKEKPQYEEMIASYLDSLIAKRSELMKSSQVKQ